MELCEPEVRILMAELTHSGAGSEPREEKKLDLDPTVKKIDCSDRIRTRPF
jgi:hypothetical protein